MLFPLYLPKTLNTVFLPIPAHYSLYPPALLIKMSYWTHFPFLLAHLVAPLCQVTCVVIKGCQYFTYNSVSGTCDLYHKRYLKSCQVIGGPAVPAMDDCLDNREDSCESFIEEDCKYNSTIVTDKTSVADPHACQQLLALLGDVLGASYWVYDSTVHHCYLYSSQGRYCEAISGPKTPLIDSFENQSSTATSISTTPTSSITTTMITTENTTTLPPSSDISGLEDITTIGLKLAIMMSHLSQRIQCVSFQTFHFQMMCPQP